MEPDLIHKEYFSTENGIINKDNIPVFIFKNDKVFFLKDDEELILSKNTIISIVQNYDSYLESKDYKFLRNEIIEFQCKTLRKEKFTLKLFLENNKENLLEENYKKAVSLLNFRIEELSKPFNFDFLKEHHNDIFISKYYNFLEFFKNYKETLRNQLLNFI